jgi:aspartyl-tRNA(Asn)/glutamyl-tRNA(Gln) amidotransferase subunit A
MAMASSLDQIGPITRNVEDAEVVFDFIKGVDKNDSTTYIPKEIKNNKTNVVGIPYEILKQGVDQDVLDNFNISIDKLKKLGYEIKDISLPYIQYSLALYYILMPAEVSSNLARFDGVRFGLHKDAGSVVNDYFKTRGEGFGKEVRRRIMLGTYVLSSGYYDAYYSKAQNVRKLLTEDFIKAFENVDVVATPTSPMPAWKFGEKSKDPLSMYLADIFTVSANLSGIPAISIPCGEVVRENKNLPVGIQFMANHFREDIIFDIAKKFQ